MTQVADLTIGPPPPPEVRPQEPRPVVVGDGQVDDLREVPQVTDEQVRIVLKGFGGMAGLVIGDDDVPDHWRFTERELDDLTPPMTRVINRNAQLRRAVIRGDEMAIVVALSGYAGRNVADAKKARDRRRELEAEAEPAQGDGGADGQGVPGGDGWHGSDGGGFPGPAGGGFR